VRFRGRRESQRQAVAGSWWVCFLSGTPAAPHPLHVVDALGTYAGGIAFAVAVLLSP